MPERRDLPLFRWGEELRALRRRRVLRRRAVGVGAGVMALVATIALRPAPVLVWNASPSAPLGLYFVRPNATVAAGDMVIANLPGQARTLAAERHYLPRDVPLVKRVEGVAGDIVCARRDTITINGELAVRRLPADRKGRPLPWWEGCHALRAGETFLLMKQVRDSFDGRYFGVTARADLIGKADALWTR